MASATEVCPITQIGETAGAIWRALSDKGPQTIARLIKEIDAPRDVVMQAIGWLAREHKIAIDDEGRSRTVSLR
ncbi:MAG TPA: winged helix-turn-helix domain-containing protein [Pirellulales bacterium]|nr:winged helix-turn-helix domain-containing protein [Pirellulales bacterium]